MLNTSLRRIGHIRPGGVSKLSLRAFSQASPVEPKKGFFHPDSVFATPKFKNRWLMTIPAFLTHMSIGSPWAWSVVSGLIQKEQGFVASAADDWTFRTVTAPMAIVFTLQGLAAASLGGWINKVGPRTAMSVAGLCFGGGLMVGGAGILYHSLPLLYLGYGVLAGIGVGVAYTPPIQALVEWFPDRKGLATGITIAGFGSGALFFAPISLAISKWFATMPTFVGPSSSVTITSEKGRLFAEYEGALREVVVASKGDLAQLPYQLSEGVYLVGTGGTGVGQMLLVTGAGYMAIMLVSAVAIRRPAKGYAPEGWTPPPLSASVVSRTSAVHYNTVFQTPQYYQLATTFFCVACGGMGILAVAKPMVNEVFSATLPHIVTSAFAAKFVMALSAANLGGRLFWGPFSDKFGRRLTFHIFCWGSIPLYLAIPWFVDAVVKSGSVVPLYGFMGISMAAVASMGGIYAQMPAYESDLYGVKYVGAIHGRFLLASTAAAIAGPMLLLQLRSIAEFNALTELLKHVDPILFQAKFGAPIAAAAELIASKAISIHKLMEIVPAGTADPTPYLYDTTMYSMAGLMLCAALSHQLVKPVDKKYFEVPEAIPQPAIPSSKPEPPVSQPEPKLDLSK